MTLEGVTTNAPHSPDCVSSEQRIVGTVWAVCLEQGHLSSESGRKHFPREKSD